jgi:hypothetical protein
VWNCAKRWCRKSGHGELRLFGAGIMKPRQRKPLLSIFNLSYNDSFYTSKLARFKIIVLYYCSIVRPLAVSKYSFHHDITQAGIVNIIPMISKL